ncbi:MAG: PQQ-binding-like beta-propeller repeat protein, partial [bacterium]
MGGRILLNFSLLAASIGSACGPASSPTRREAKALSRATTVGSANPPKERIVASQFRGDAGRSGRTEGRGPPRSPGRLWTFQTGGPVFSSPALGQDGTIYFGSLDGAVYAVGPKGDLAWRFATGDAVWSSPAISGATVLVGSSDDTVYGLASRTGEVRFARRLGACGESPAKGPDATRCDADGPPAVGTDGTIWVGADGLYGLSRDGQLRVSVATAHVFGGPAVAPGGRVYFGAQDDRLRAVEPDGRLVWEFRAGDDIDSTPAVLPDGGVVFGSDDDRVYALHPDGTQRFALQTRGDVRAAPAIAADGTIYAASFDGRLYAVAPDGTLKFAFRAGGRILSS